MNASLSNAGLDRDPDQGAMIDSSPGSRDEVGYAALSVRAASRFAIGAAIVRDLVGYHSPGTPATVENVAIAALRSGPGGERLRSSIELLADQEAAWFRSTPSHALASKNVLSSRGLEVNGLNATNMAVLATMEPHVLVGERSPNLQAHYQAAIRAIDEMPGTTAELRTIFQELEKQVMAAGSDSVEVQSEMSTAQRAYLSHLMTERLAAYQVSSPSELPQEADLVI
jgi:hypothetical protein